MTMQGISYSEPEEIIGLVQGRKPDSKEEYWVSQALYRYRIPFDFQFELFHGRDRRGGLIVDFVVWNPMINPLLVHGKYWHRGQLKGGDVTIMVAIADYFHIATENLLVLWGSDAKTKDDVFAWVRANVAR